MRSSTAFVRFSASRTNEDRLSRLTGDSGDISGDSGVVPDSSLLRKCRSTPVVSQNSRYFTRGAVLDTLGCGCTRRQRIELRKEVIAWLSSDARRRRRRVRQARSCAISARAATPSARPAARCRKRRLSAAQRSRRWSATACGGRPRETDIRALRPNAPFADDVTAGERDHCRSWTNMRRDSGRIPRNGLARGSERSHGAGMRKSTI